MNIRTRKSISHNHHQQHRLNQHKSFGNVLSFILACSFIHSFRHSFSRHDDDWDTSKRKSSCLHEFFIQSISLQFPSPCEEIIQIQFNAIQFKFPETIHPQINNWIDLRIFLKPPTQFIYLHFHLISFHLLFTTHFRPHGCILILRAVVLVSLVVLFSFYFFLFNFPSGEEEREKCSFIRTDWRILSSQIVRFVSLLHSRSVIFQLSLRTRRYSVSSSVRLIHQFSEFSRTRSCFWTTEEPGIRIIHSFVKRLCP